MLRIRFGMDGCLWIHRSDPETEADLDGQYHRLPNQLKWYSKIPILLSELKNMFPDSLCYVVGKGPSLDNITAGCFPDPQAPIICINESIHVIEKLKLPNHIYVTQLDSELQETCRPINARMFYGPMCANLYETGVYKYLIDPHCFGLTSAISAEFAI